MDTVTPARLVQQHLDVILSNLAGVFDGDVESVHQARIATRRMREVIPLLDDPDLDPVADAVRDAGRALGRVRELDVMSTLLHSLGDRLPISVATELHGLQLEVRRRQRVARRDMVKRLEHLDLASLRDLLAQERTPMMRRWLTRAHVLAAPWLPAIWTRIRERSEDAAEASRRTPAVYFPRRAHATRIAVKKLRYALEVAADAGIWQPRRMLKDLRRIQGILGEIHDHQVLIDLIGELQSSGREPGVTGSGLTDLLQAEIDRQHAEYARRRKRIVAIADACARATAPRRIVAPLVAASVLAAPVLIASSAMRRRHEPVTQACIA